MHDLVLVKSFLDMPMSVQMTYLNSPTRVTAPEAICTNCPPTIVSLSFFSERVLNRRTAYLLNRIVSIVCEGLNHLCATLILLDLLFDCVCAFLGMFMADVGPMSIFKIKL